MAELVRVKMVDPILGRKLTHISSGGLWMHGLLGISGVASLGKDPNGGANILLLCFKGLKHCHDLGVDVNSSKLPAFGSI